MILNRLLSMFLCQLLCIFFETRRLKQAGQGIVVCSQACNGE